jgi:hypothetical protein
MQHDFNLDIIVSLICCPVLFLKHIFYDRKLNLEILEDGFFTPNSSRFWGGGCWRWDENETVSWMGRKKKRFRVVVNDSLYDSPRQIRIEFKQEQEEIIKIFEEEFAEIKSFFNNES